MAVDHRDPRDTNFPRYDSLFIGIVVANDDPLKLKRIRVKIPGLVEPFSCWAFPMMAMLGENEGFSYTPKVTASVCVWFVNGEVEHPVYAPGPWGKPKGVSDVPDESADNDDVFSIRWRNMRLTFDGTPGTEKLIVEDATSGTKIEIDKNTGNLDEVVTGDLTQTISADKSVLVNGSQEKTVIGDDSESIGGSKALEIKGDRVVEVTGDSTEEVLGTKQIGGLVVNITSLGPINVQSAGTLTLQGAAVQEISGGTGLSRSQGLKTKQFLGGILEEIDGVWDLEISGKLTWLLNAIATLQGSDISIGAAPYQRLATEEFVLSLYNAHTHTDSNGGSTTPPLVQASAAHLTTALKGG